MKKITTLFFLFVLILWLSIHQNNYSTSVFKEVIINENAYQTYVIKFNKNISELKLYKYFSNIKIIQLEFFLPVRLNDKIQNDSCYLNNLLNNNIVENCKNNLIAEMQLIGLSKLADNIKFGYAIINEIVIEVPVSFIQILRQKELDFTYYIL